MLNLLSKPYPYLFSLKRTIISSIVIGVFIGISSFFSFNGMFFQDLIISKLEMSLCFGLITFLSIIIVFGLIPFSFISETQRDNWTFLKEISLFPILIFVISVLNTFFIIFVSTNPVSEPFNLFLYALALVSIFAIFPIVVRIWLNYTFILIKNLQQTQVYNQKLVEIINANNKIEEQKIIEIHTENQNEILKLDINTLLFIRAENNYVEVYIKKSKQVTKSLYRMSLQTVEDNMKNYPNIIRTHRSYMVNVKNIKLTTGNARNYQLFFEGTNQIVPVARSRFKDFNTAFIN